MPETPWDRRELLKALSAGAATGFLAGAARDAAAQQVKWSEGTEPPKLKAPPNACDCHHHIYDARYPVDPKAVLRPGDALVEDYRAFQKRIGTSRNVVVTPSTYGVDNGRRSHKQDQSNSNGIPRFHDFFSRGTGSSNPSPSSGESRANSTPRLRQPARSARDNRPVV